MNEFMVSNKWRELFDMKWGGWNWMVDVDCSGPAQRLIFPNFFINNGVCFDIDMAIDLLLPSPIYKKMKFLEPNLFWHRICILGLFLFSISLTQYLGGNPWQIKLFDILRKNHKLIYLPKLWSILTYFSLVIRLSEKKEKYNLFYLFLQNIDSSWFISFYYILFQFY